MKHSSLKGGCCATKSSKAAMPLLSGARRWTEEGGGNEGLVSHKRPVSKEKANLGASELL